MYIKSVLSHFGGWQKLSVQFQPEFNELVRILETVKLNDLKKLRRSSNFHNPTLNTYAHTSLHSTIYDRLLMSNWIPQDLNNRITLGSKPNQNVHYTQLDALKNGVCIDLSFGKFAFSESSIFVKFPIFIQAKRAEIGVLIVPADDLRDYLTSGVGGFSMIKNRLKALSFLPLKYPFTMIGISHTKVDEPEIEELSTEIDCYLNEKLGLTMFELKLQAENRNYDFKTELPGQNEKVAKEICAFANLKGGGFLLIGFDNTGEMVGIRRDEKDRMEQRITSIAHSSVSPAVEIEIRTFEVPNDDRNCVLIAQIHESTQKPCVANDRVYIRTGTEALPAKSEDIRKMVLGGD